MSEEKDKIRNYIELWANEINKKYSGIMNLNDVEMMVKKIVKGDFSDKQGIIKQFFIERLIILERVNNFILEKNSLCPGFLSDEEINNILNRSLMSDRSYEEIEHAIYNYDGRLEKIEEFERIFSEVSSNEIDSNNLYLLGIDTKKTGLYLSSQEIDLLMITNLNSKEEIINYVNNCSQFLNKSIDELLPNLNLLDSNNELLDSFKEKLYMEYLNTLTGYLEYNSLSDDEKKNLKIKKMNIDLSNVDYQTVHRFKNDDFENVKAVSYAEMKSLNELIKSGNINSITIACGKFDDIMFKDIDGYKFDPYYVERAFQYCKSHNINMRYHALFDYGHAKRLLDSGLNSNNKEEILNSMKSYIKDSFDFIEKCNLEKPGTIDSVVIFNELVEKNKSKKDINSEYVMIWEKWFGINERDLMSCFDSVSIPKGINFIYNETTLAESSKKRDKVLEVFNKLKTARPNFIDTFGAQLHLSDDDLFGKDNNNLQDVASLLLVIQKDVESIECTEHDFHFSKSLSTYFQNLKNIGVSIDDKVYAVKNNLQTKISNVFKKKGVRFSKITYWNKFEKNDHNLVRVNKKYQDEFGKKSKRILSTMYAGLIKDGNNFKANSSLKKSDVVKGFDDERKKELSAMKDESVVKVAEKQNSSIKSDVKSYKKISNSRNSSNKGYINAFIYILLISTLFGVAVLILYLLK